MIEGIGHGDSLGGGVISYPVPSSNGRNLRMGASLVVRTTKKRGGGLLGVNLAWCPPAFWSRAYG